MNNRVRIADDSKSYHVMNTTEILFFALGQVWDGYLCGRSLVLIPKGNITKCEKKITVKKHEISLKKESSSQHTHTKETETIAKLKQKTRFGHNVLNVVSMVFDNETSCKLKDGRIRRTSHLNQTLFIFFHRPDGFMKLQIENDVPRFTKAIFRH